MATTVERARELGAKIKTAQQANDAIRLTLATLRKSVGLLNGFTFTDKATGVSSAWAGRIEQQINRTAQLQRRLQGGFDVKQSNAIGLAIVQARDLLASLRKAVATSQNEGTVTALLEQFAAAMKEILEAAGRAAVGALPWWVWAGVAFALLDKRNTR